MDINALPGLILRFLRLVKLLGMLQTITFAISRFLGEAAPIAFHLKGIRHPVYIRPTGYDIFCLGQIFDIRECHLELWPPPQVIIDGGAHIGLASIYFSNLFPNAKIIAVEPESSNYELAMRNLQYYPNVHLIRSAIWGRDARLIIENPEAASNGFRVREVSHSTTGAFMGRSICSILRELRLAQADLIKLDIEGAEAEVFAAAPLDWLDRNRAIIVETHGEKAEIMVDRAMKQRGYHFLRQGEKFIYVRQTVGADVELCLAR